MVVKGVVLLLEDNQRILDLNRRMLEDEGLTVLTARSLAEARECLGIAIPDIAVLDIMLPDGNGVDFLKELKEACEAPVLFLTAKAEQRDIIAGLAAGGNDYITKPYDIDELCMRILGLLRLTKSVNKRNTAQDEGVKSGTKLTKGELSIAHLTAKGLSNKEIGDATFLSESRIKTSLTEIYRKLGISDKKEKRDLLAKILNVR